MPPAFHFAAPPAPPPPRVPQQTVLIIVWVFYALTITATGARLGLRLRSAKRLQLDDYLLLVAVACLTAASGILHWGLPAVYQVLAISLDPLGAGLPKDLLGLIHRFQVILFTYIPLTWLSIFCAKFSYLWFFRQLVDRIRPLVIYWRVVVGLTSVVGVLCFLQTYIACPHTDASALSCAQGEAYNRSFSLSINSMVLDIISDVLIVSIPVCLLWRVRIAPSQKLGLAAFLCLSVVMAVMAIVRVSGLRIASVQGVPAFDTAWQYLWQQIEACLAVCLVSLTAFRSLFVARANSKKRSKESPHATWYSTTVARIRARRRKRGGYEADVGRLPQIPNPILSGMRTFIQGGPSRKSTLLTGSTATHNSASSAEEWLPEERAAAAKAWKARQQPQRPSQHIRVTSGITREVEQSHYILPPVSSSLDGRRARAAPPPPRYPHVYPPQQPQPMPQQQQQQQPMPQQQQQQQRSWLRDSEPTSPPPPRPCGERPLPPDPPVYASR